MNNTKKIKVAIIDMNRGVANQGIRGIQEILSQYEAKHKLKFTTDIFDIRLTSEVPDLSYHLYISSGGPGSPYDGEGKQWEKNFFDLLAKIEDFNHTNTQKKNVFLICHSFQLACKKYKLGDIIPRKSTSFGIFPITLTSDGEKEPLFNGLPNPFYSVDSRNWQVVQPNQSAFDRIGAKLLAIEKERPHAGFERCIMAVRFSPYIIGTQFHPEADPLGMKKYFLLPEKKRLIVKNYGEEKYDDMLHSLENPERIILTQSVILPQFLTIAIDAIDNA